MRDWFLGEPFCSLLHIASHRKLCHAQWQIKIIFSMIIPTSEALWSHWPSTKNLYWCSPSGNSIIVKKSPLLEQIIISHWYEMMEQCWNKFLSVTLLKWRNTVKQIFFIMSVIVAIDKCCCLTINKWLLMRITDGDTWQFFYFSIKINVGTLLKCFAETFWQAEKFGLLNNSKEYPLKKYTWTSCTLLIQPKKVCNVSICNCNNDTENCYGHYFSII